MFAWHELDGQKTISNGVEFNIAGVVVLTFIFVLVILVDGAQKDLRAVTCFLKFLCPFLFCFFIILLA